MWLVDSEDLALRSWGFTVPTRALPGIKLCGFRLCVPPVYRVLMAFKPSAFSFLPFLFSPYGYFHFVSSWFWWGECFYHSLPPSLTSLRKQKSSLSSIWLLSPPVHLSVPCTCWVLWFQLSRLFVNPNINFPGVKNGLCWSSCISGMREAENFQAAPPSCPSSALECLVSM